MDDGKAEVVMAVVEMQAVVRLEEATAGGCTEAVATDVVAKVAAAMEVVEKSACRFCEL